MEIVDSCEKTRTHEQSVNTCHMSSGKLLKKAPSVWASEDGEGVSAGPPPHIPPGEGTAPANPRRARGHRMCQRSEASYSSWP